MKNTKGWLLGLFAAFAASLCCITPILAIIGGIGGSISYFDWLNPYREYLIAFTVIVFAFAWYQKLKPKKVDPNCDCEEEKTSFFQSKKFLGLLTLFSIILLTFPYYSHAFYPKQEKKIANTDVSTIKKENITVLGMDCSECTNHIDYELFQIKGIQKVKTSYKNEITEISFDTTMVSLNTIKKRIELLGYETK